MNLLKTGAALVGRGLASWEMGKGGIGGAGSLGKPSDSGQTLRGKVEEAN